MVCMHAGLLQNKASGVVKQTLGAGSFKQLQCPREDSRLKEFSNPLLLLLQLLRVHLNKVKSELDLAHLPTAL